MFIKTRASCLCLIILILLVGHKLAFADPLLSASQQDLFKMSIGLKPGQPKDEPVYIEPIPCAHWLFTTHLIHGAVNESLELRSEESVRRSAYLAYLGLPDSPDKLPPTSTEYIMLKIAIDQSLAGVGLIEVKSRVLEICNRYEDEFVTPSGRSSNPSPRFKGIGKY